MDISALAARIEAAMASSRSMSERHDISDETRGDRLWIGQRFHELRRLNGRDSFTEAEIRAKMEWLEGVLVEAIK